MAENEDAPHGYDDDGKPLAPYGLTVNGKPRKSNRGARPGQRGNGGSRSRTTSTRPKATIGNRTDKQRRDMLISLADMMIVTPLATLPLGPLATRIGEKHAAALSGDAVILEHYLPDLADGLIVLSQSKPGALAWLDTVEEKAPYLMLMKVGIEVGKAIISNHMTPNPELARAGRLMAATKVTQMIAAVEAEAAAAGVTEDTMVIPQPEENAA